MAKPGLQRRLSIPIEIAPSNWMEAAVLTVKEFVCIPNSFSSSRAFWHTWESVCVDWSVSTSSTRKVAEVRLLTDSLANRRVSLWREVLSVPEIVDEEEFNSVLMDGSYSSWAEIARDSRRTYASILRKRPDLHLQLTRILHALATRFKDVGYCQGMNFVACTILLGVASIEDPSIGSIASPKLPNREPLVDDELVSPDTFMSVIQTGNPVLHERIAFKLCEKLFVRNHFVRIYEVGLFTRLSIWSFDKLVESQFPELHEMITHQLQVSADFYTSTWFMTLFSADLDLSSSLRILDVFIAKGPKALHRFGLACLSMLEIRLMNPENDVAEALRLLRGSAVTAVAEVGIEYLVQYAMHEYKCVTNRLLADLQTAGKVHGGACLIFVTDRDTLVRSGVVVPPALAGDSSPSGAAFEAEWSKEEAQIKSAPVITNMGFIASKFHNLKARPSLDGGGFLNADEDEDETLHRGNSMSPERKFGARKALKSLGKKISSILPKTMSKGYSRTDDP